MTPETPAKVTALFTPEEQQRYEELVRLGASWATGKGLNSQEREELAKRLVMEERNAQ